MYINLMLQRGWLCMQTHKWLQQQVTSRWLFLAKGGDALRYPINNYENFEFFTQMKMFICEYNWTKIKWNITHKWY